MDSTGVPPPGQRPIRKVKSLRHLRQKKGLPAQESTPMDAALSGPMQTFGQQQQQQRWLSTAASPFTSNWPGQHTTPIFPGISPGPQIQHTAQLTQQTITSLGGRAGGYPVSQIPISSTILRSSSSLFGNQAAGTTISAPTETTWLSGGTNASSSPATFSLFGHQAPILFGSTLEKDQDEMAYEDRLMETRDSSFDADTGKVEKDQDEDMPLVEPGPISESTNVFPGSTMPDCQKRKMVDVNSSKWSQSFIKSNKCDKNKNFMQDRPSKKRSISMYGNKPFSKSSKIKLTEQAAPLTASSTSSSNALHKSDLKLSSTTSTSIPSIITAEHVQKHTRYTQLPDDAKSTLLEVEQFVRNQQVFSYSIQANSNAFGGEGILYSKDRTGELMNSTDILFGQLELQSQMVFCLEIELQKQMEAAMIGKAMVYGNYAQHIIVAEKHHHQYFAQLCGGLRHQLDDFKSTVRKIDLQLVRQQEMTPRMLPQRIGALISAQNELLVSLAGQTSKLHKLVQELLPEGPIIRP